MRPNKFLVEFLKEAGFPPRSLPHLQISSTLLTTKRMNVCVFNYETHQSETATIMLEDRHAELKSLLAKFGVLPVPIKKKEVVAVAVCT